MINFAIRRKFFDDYAERIGTLPPSLAKYQVRLTCPCCCYPTLRGRAAYEICFLCDWEDDGQDDHDADASSIVNHGYTLEQARETFVRHGVMYEPDADPRIGGADSAEAVAVKQRVTGAFHAMMQSPAADHEPQWAVVHGSLCAEGTLLYLRKTRSGWAVVKERMLWIS